MAKIYVSSTYDDLVEFRKAVFDALTSLRHHVVAMEHYLASDRRPVEKCLADVAACDVYVGIVGWRYGYVPARGNRARRSITQLEYEKAGAERKPRLIFLLHEDAPWHRKWDDSVTEENGAGSRIRGLRQQMQRDHTVGFFKTADELARLVSNAVTTWEREDARAGPRARAPLPAPADVPPGYLPWLKRECGSIELLGLRLKQGQHVRISNVYVPLFTKLAADDLDSGRVRLRKASSIEEAASAGRPDEPTMLLRLLERHSLYMTGPPGSGKSTFCRWVAWLLAEGTLPPHEISDSKLEERFPETLRGKLPVLVRLRDFQRVLPERRDLGVRQLERALESWLADRTPGGLEWPALSALIDRGRAALILDGADEVHPSRRQALVTGLAECLHSWHEKGNRVLLTSRPYGLTDGEVRRLGLPHTPVSGLTGPLQRLLVRRWFVILADDADAGATTAEGLLADLRNRDWLYPLAENPLLLTAMCIVYGQGRRLPQDKHELYDRIVDTVLHSRFDPKIVPLVRNRLAVVAHGMHTGESLDETRETPEAETTEKELDRMLEAYQKADPYFTEEGFKQVSESRETLLSDSGLLLPLDGRRAAFYHLSLQEFLAGERMADVDREQLLAVFRTRGGRPEWRNTLSFLFGAQLANNAAPRRAVELLVTLLEPSRASMSPALAALAADCVEILHGRGVRLRDESLQPLREFCLTGLRGALTPEERCELGESLARIGDVRFRSDAWQLPDDPLLGFVEIPAGAFRMGSDRQRDNAAHDDEEPARDLDVGRFYIARWPVTVAQFRAFVEDKEANGGFVPGDADCLRGVDNHPVVWVSWAEAQQYCAWLTAKIRFSVSTPAALGALLNATDEGPMWQVGLPSEAEWEKAARGTDGRIYPWGDQPDPNRANYFDTKILTTSAVGCFPGGVSPYGVEELSGNVWEWTRSLYRPYQDDAADGREDLHEDGARVVRGGSFNRDDWHVRAAYRLHSEPDYRDWFIGFRVVVSRFRALISDVSDP